MINFPKEVAASESCNKGSKIDSIYWWEDQLQESTEIVLNIKTRLDLLNEVIVAIKNLHSYNVPEIIYFRASASDEYNQWINKVTNKLK